MTVRFASFILGLLFLLSVQSLQSQVHPDTGDRLAHTAPLSHGAVLVLGSLPPSPL